MMKKINNLVFAASMCELKKSFEKKYFKGTDVTVIVLVLLIRI